MGQYTSEMSSEPNLRAGFDAAFIYPFASHSWKSKRGRLYWVDLEYWQDALAGPISSVVEAGDCAYVYTRDDEYFAGVYDPDALRTRLQQWHDRLTVSLNDFVPASPGEADDLASMRRFASEMWVVVEQAIGIERARWGAARDTPS
jgi:hypothetical protein